MKLRFFEKLIQAKHLHSLRTLKSRIQVKERVVMQKVSVAEAKSHISEFIAKSAYNNERFVITRRNKPVAALVSLDDLRIIEQYEERKGLADVIGKWEGFDEVVNALGNLTLLRKSGGCGRNVSL